jgi:serine/threonine protein kinase
MQSIPRIPGYHLLGYLGGGPMTAVYEARAAGSGAPCAIKVVRAEWEDRVTAVKLLQREARAGMAARHPHLVCVLDAHVLHAPHYLVMELLPGETLRRRLRREYRLPLAEALWVARQTAEALAALHQAGFLHGDVKPDNLRLVEDGRAVLIDLGFAHRPGENAAFLRAGYVLGTADYLAPEQCDPMPAEDYSSDLFSLGVTLFELLTGRLPYPPGSLRQTFRRHRCDPPASLRCAALGPPSLRCATLGPVSVPQGAAGPLPPALVGLVERLLAREPEERPRAPAVVQQLIRLEIAALRSPRGRRSA